MPEPEHTTSLAVWDVSSPVVAGRRPSLKVGVSCTAGCNLSGTAIDVFNDAGDRIGTATLGATPWPATAALYWAELDLDAPERAGDLPVDIRATPTLPHAHATSVVTFGVSRPPEYQVTLRVTDKTSGAPLAGVELRLGTFRATTDDAGIARLEVPGGTYEMATWKNDYEIISKTVRVSADATVDVELIPEREAEQPYWM